MKKYTALLLCIIILFTSACRKSGSDNPKPNSGPTISTLSVSSGPFNTNVVITGTGFSATIANDEAFFNGKAATITAATTTQLTVKVPLGAGTGKVTVSVNNGTPASGPVFTYQFSAIVSTIAGNETSGSVDGKGTAASFYAPWGIVMDAAGNLYVSDFGSTLIRKITPDATVTTIAGNNSYTGVDGKGKAASFMGPAGMAIDATGNLYVADMQSIRKVTPDGTVSTVAGSKFYNNSDFAAVALDAAGNLYAADLQNHVILKIKPNGTAAVFAGSGTEGSVDGTGAAASFDLPDGLAIDAAGNLFVADEGANLIRKITPAGVASTVAGSGSSGAANGKGIQASFNNPVGINVDAAGNLYIGDFGNDLIRKIASDGTVTTLAGSGSMGSDDGIGTLASFAEPNDLILDPSGNLYLADGSRVREITIQ